MVIADFSRVDVVTCSEKLYLAELMERDDITVVCEGLFGQLENEKVFLAVSYTHLTLPTNREV